MAATGEKREIWKRERDGIGERDGGEGGRKEEGESRERGKGERG